MNFPAAWNLRGALKPENAPTVAVFDVAFAPHDDLLATGGTALALCELVEGLGGHVAACSFLIELSFLPGRQRLAPRQVLALIDYEE